MRRVKISSRRYFSLNSTLARSIRASECDDFTFVAGGKCFGEHGVEYKKRKKKRSEGKNESFEKRGKKGIERIGRVL